MVESDNIDNQSCTFLGKLGNIVGCANLIWIKRNDKKQDLHYASVKLGRYYLQTPIHPLIRYGR